MKNHSKRRSERIKLQNSPYPTEKRNQFDFSSSLSPGKDAPTVVEVELTEDNVPAISLSDSLMLFAKGQIEAELSNLFASFCPKSTQDERTAFCENVFNQLVQITLNETQEATNLKANNEIFSKHHKSFIRSLHLFNDAKFEAFYNKELSLQQVLEDYDEFIHRNQIIFENITTHHDEIVNVEWDKVVENTDSLQDYAVAANEMGNKIWVYESNRYACNYCVKFFIGCGPQNPNPGESNPISTQPTTGNSNLAIKFFMKENHQKQVKQQKSSTENDKEKNTNENIENDKSYWDSLHSTLSPLPLIDYFGNPQSNKIKLLDIGSCYNPLLKFEDLLPFFDCTAIDLCPVDPSVYKCDFLTVEVAPSLEQYQTHKVQSDTTVNIVSSHPSSSSYSASNYPSNVYREVKMLPANYYDVAVMSLVLSYLPTPSARELMIEKARQLLVTPGHNGKPHYGGLLIIIEKQSIFSPVNKSFSSSQQRQAKQKQTEKENNSSSDPLPTEECVITCDDWKTIIAQKGFFLLSYQLYISSDKRKSHIFIFKTAEITPSTSNSGSSTSDVSAEMTAAKPLWIKQDFFRSKESKS
jgi:hypothetical protein